jgi:hypothetical protein
MNTGMRARIAPMALLVAGMLLAAGCSGGGNGGGARPGEVLSYEPDGPTAGRIEITTVAQRALVRAELRLPDGRVEPAAILEHSTVMGPSGGGIAPGVGVGVGVFGGSSSGIGTGVSIGVPLGGGRRMGEAYLRSRARIVLRDAAAYRRDWRGARVHLDFGENADPRTLLLPAPEPHAP